MQVRLFIVFLVTLFAILFVGCKNEETGGLATETPQASLIVQSEVPTETATYEPIETPDGTPAVKPTDATENVVKAFNLPLDNTKYDREFAQQILRINNSKDPKQYGFRTIVSGNLTPKQGDHTAGFVISKKNTEYKGENKELVLLLIYPTQQNEWYSNFDFAPSRNNETKYAENFNIAANDIIAKTQAILNGNQIIIVTGYSRGAAVANLVAKKLNDKGYFENVFAYTFATPTTTRMDDEGENANVFNVININDIVPKLPPEYMGFRRFGTDIVFGEKTEITENIESVLLEIQKICPDINAYYNKKFSLTSGIAGEGKSVFEIMSQLFDVNTIDDLKEISDESKLSLIKKLFSPENMISIAMNHAPISYTQI